MLQPKVNSAWQCWRAGIHPCASLALLVCNLWPLHPWTYSDWAENPNMHLNGFYGYDVANLSFMM